MMFRKISLIASLLFFLLGTNVFANSHIESSANHSTKSTTNKMIAAEGKKTTNVNQNSFNTYIVPGCVTIVLLLAFGSYWLIYRRKVV